jgi:hypothetical protein
MVGEYTAGRLVEDQVITELKVVAPLSDVHLPQSRNDLRATRKPLFLLINFGRPKAGIRRVTPLSRAQSPLSRAQSPKPDRDGPSCFIPAYPANPPSKRESTTTLRHCVDTARQRQAGTAAHTGRYAGVREARIVLPGDVNLIRARITASWLFQLGLSNVWWA